MKNFIIGHGETLTKAVIVKSGSGDKSHPYTIEEAKMNFIEGLSAALGTNRSKPDIQCADNKIVIKFIQHPTYLAKSYYPKKFFERFNLKDVGSKPIKIKPKKWGVKKHPNEGLSSCIFVSGNKDDFEHLIEKIEANEVSDTTLSFIRTFEEIKDFEASDKIKGIDRSNSSLKLEVVLHADINDQNIKKSFSEYINHLNGKADWLRAKSVSGLTFIPVTINLKEEIHLAEFSHLRVMRSMPTLRINKPEAFRQALDIAFELPSYVPLTNDFKVCIFDGGIGNQHLLTPWVNEVIPDDVKSSHPSYLSHGSEVCSSYLFGPFDKNTGKFGLPYTDIDIVRVLSPDDHDHDLFDVLSRIEHVLKLKKYKYVNLSLGPNLPIEDDDVHVWTSVLDSILESGECLATVAVGNDGDLAGDNARIQPPSDMVNCFSIGATNSNDKSWSKAPYSSIGPGRSPGLVKPDGVIFGGSEESPFHVYSPLTDKIIGTMGTSFAAPYALRVAAGIDAITDLPLKPATVKALMIHHASNKEFDLRDVGWGRLPNNPEQIIECLDDEAIILYQGELKQSQHLRVPIPVPDGIDAKWVHIKATFCFTAITDPEHPLHYTRGGLEISFRANDSKFKKDAEHAETKTLFSTSKLYPAENELRDDAHKWETSLSAHQRFKSTTLSNPVMDVKYHAREKGGDAPNDLEPLNYSLIVSIRAEGDPNTYNLVLQQNQTLKSVKITNQIQIS